MINKQDVKKNEVPFPNSSRGMLPRTLPSDHMIPPNTYDSQGAFGQWVQLLTRV